MLERVAASEKQASLTAEFAYRSGIAGGANSARVVSCECALRYDLLGLFV